MPLVPASTTLELVSMVSTAATPVVLVTATAILLSGFTAKYNHLADQMRGLSTEYRNAVTLPARRESIAKQLRLFRCRVDSMWISSFLLTVALVAFVTMILEVIFVAKVSRLSVVGAVTLVIGLLLMLLAVVTELYEIYLSRLTADEELSDIAGAEARPK